MSAALRSSRFILISIILTGCSAKVADEPTVDPITAPPIAQAQWCEAHARVVCTRLVACCKAVDLGGDEASCTKNVLTKCEATSDAHVAAGDTYNAQAAGTCIAGDAWLWNGCDTTTSGLTYEAVDPTATAVEAACLSVWKGTAPLGAACKESSDCAALPDGTKVRCGSSETGAAKTCVAWSGFASVGEACGRPAGGPLMHCERGLLCIAADATSTQRCVERASRGEACKPYELGHCREGLTCDPATKTCSDPLPLGAACYHPVLRVLGKLVANCAPPGECDFRTQVCTNPLPLDAACVPDEPTTFRSRCGHYASCSSLGQCVAREPDGSTCTSSNECLGYACSGHRCVTSGTLARADSCTLAGGGPR